MKNKESPVVVITGGGTGIGAACARKMAENGAHVILLGRRKEPIEQLATEIGGFALCGDASSHADWEVFLPTIINRYKHIDTVICSTGSMVYGGVADMSDADWELSMNSNLTAAFATARACLPELIKTKGSILFIASIASMYAAKGVSGYTTSKHALIGLMRAIARDYGTNGVRSNAVCPGWVKTPMSDEEMLPLMQAKHSTLDEAYSYVCKNVPLGRAATVEEIATICEFICSKAASIITGASIVADGGATIVDMPTLAFDEI